MNRQSIGINFIFIFLVIEGVDLFHQFLNTHFQFLRLLLLANYLLFLLLSFFIRRLTQLRLRRFLIGSYLFIIGGLFSLLYGNPFEFSAWFLYFVGAFFGAILWDYFCQKFSIRGFVQQLSNKK
jgi:hypothetical protein